MKKDYLKEETEKAFSRTAKEIENALKKTPVTAEQMDAGFLIGFENAKETFKKAIDYVAGENRRLQKENLILKCNNVSLAKQNEELLRKINDSGENGLDDNSDSGNKSDALSYFELF